MLFGILFNLNASMNKNYNCGGRIRTYDIKGMNLANYHCLLRHNINLTKIETTSWFGILLLDY